MRPTNKYERVVLQRKHTQQQPQRTHTHTHRQLMEKARLLDEQRAVRTT